MKARPFLKWAGGKSQLLDTFESFYPEKLKHGKINRYIEPFVGAGAVFFDLIGKYDFREVILNDINQELILTYRVIQNKADDLIKFLEELENTYINMEMIDKEKLFYNQRELFNMEKENLDYNIWNDDFIAHAGRMIFLNKTCFNGLYRQNRKGQYNVPFGKRKKAAICDKKNLYAVSSALQGIKLLSGDFEELTEYVDNNTFLYIDPPYRPLNVTSSFTDYSKEPFDDEEQIRLSKWVQIIDEKGALFMLSNSDPTNTNADDDFFDKLYQKFNINRVNAVRAINSKGSGRGEIRELLITNIKDKNSSEGKIAV